MKSTSRLSLLLGSLTLAAASCGSSSDAAGGAIAGLSMPDAMDLVGIDETTAGSTVAAGATVSPAVTFPAGSDYHTDEVHAYMWDETTEPLEIINDILTSVGQTRADQFVNQGAYLALVETVGGDEGDGTSDTGQSSGGNATELEPWVLNSTRASATAPQVVRFWISQEEDFGAGGIVSNTIMGRATISEEPSAANPYGDFALDFGFVNDADDSLLQRGSLRTTNPGGGQQGFTFMMEDVAGFFGDDTRVAVQTNADQTEGIAHMDVPNHGGGGPATTTFTLAYNEDYFLRSDGTTTQLLDRNDFKRNTWGYNLYYAADGNGHTAGERVDIEGGFPFIWNNGGTNDYGWVDYWGIWTSDPTALTDGTTVTRDDGTGTQTYTVLRAPGKLVKVTKREIPLAELDGEAFEFWDWMSGDQYLVQYTHGTTTFTKIAERNTSTWEWEDLTPTEDLTINANEYYGFWSQALGGSLDFIGGGTAMTIREQTFVSGEDIFNGANSITLYGMNDCLRAGITTGQAETGNIFMNDIVNPANAYEYTFVESTRSLQYGGVDVGLAANANPSSGNYMWGMQSGPLSATDPVTLGITDPWEMWDLNEYYYYETGPNEWNQFATLITAQNEPVQFDNPISFMYTHATANDADDNADHDGKKVFLTYGGERNLWGIPGEEKDTDGDGFGDRWYPLFSLKDGTTLGPTGTEYVVKAVDMELFMTVSTDPIPNALQTALSGASSLTLPTLTNWFDPTGVSMPTVDDEPAVVGGVIQ